MAGKLDLFNMLSLDGGFLEAKARTATASTTTVDMKDAFGVVFVINAGVWTDGTFAFALEDSDDDSTWAAAAAADVQGSVTNITSTATDQLAKLLGYMGAKRYVRCTMTVTGSPSTGLVESITAVKGFKRDLNPLT